MLSFSKKWVASRHQDDQEKDILLIDASQVKASFLLT